MSVTLTRWKAECPGCGATETDSSEKFIRDAADAHENECDQLADDQEVAVDEAEP